MGRGVDAMKIITAALSAFVILVFFGCSVDMLDYIEEKIAEDEGTQYSFALAVATDGTGSVNIDTANSTANGNYADGTSVTAQAITNSESVFLGWYDTASGGVEISTDNPYTFTLRVDTTLYAKWTDYTDMVSVLGGTYTQTDGSNSFVHTISAFKMARYEVTYDLWYEVHIWALSNGYNFANPGKEGNDGTAGAATTADKYEPVTTINWRDAIVWCNAYSEMSDYSPVYYTDAAYTVPLKTSTDNAPPPNTTAGSEDNPYVNWSANGYRLPTEGEWQYAASNKGATPWNYGSGGTGAYTGTNSTDYALFNPIAWYGNSTTNPDGNTVKTQDVGTKTENELVIHDMSGNVWEWCWDWYETYPGTETDYLGPSSGSTSTRVIRGSSWYNDASSLQLGFRAGGYPGGQDNDIGFRLASGQ